MIRGQEWPVQGFIPIRLEKKTIWRFFKDNTFYLYSECLQSGGVFQSDTRVCVSLSYCLKSGRKYFTIFNITKDNENKLAQVLTFNTTQKIQLLTSTNIHYKLCSITIKTWTVRDSWQEKTINFKLLQACTEWTFVFKIFHRNDQQALKALLQEYKDWGFVEDTQKRRNRRKLFEKKILQYQIKLEEDNKNFFWLNQETRFIEKMQNFIDDRRLQDKEKIKNLSDQLKKLSNKLKNNQNQYKNSRNNEMVDENSEQKYRNKILKQNFERVRARLADLQKEVQKQKQINKDLNKKVQQNSLTIDKTIQSLRSEQLTMKQMMKEFDEYKGDQYRQQQVAIASMNQNSNLKQIQFQRIKQQLQDQIKQLKEQINQKERKIQDAHQQISQKKMNISNLQFRITNKDQEIKRINTKLRECQTKYQDFEKYVKDSRNLKDCQKRLQQFEAKYHDYETAIMDSRNQKQIKQQLQQCQRQIKFYQSIHIFYGETLKNMSDHQQFMKKNIESLQKRKIKYTKIIYQYKPLATTNFHQLIDDKQNIALIIKTAKGNYIAAYSQAPFIKGRVPDLDKRGLIFSLTNKLVFESIPEKRCITYDDFLLMFGNAELRLKPSETENPRLFSNFGIVNSNYRHEGASVDVLLGEGGNREVKVESYEIHQVFFR